MTGASIFVWRVRLCLALVAVGSVFVDNGQSARLQRQQVAKASTQVKCALPPSDKPGVMQAKVQANVQPNPGGTAAAPCSNHCAQPGCAPRV